MLDDVAVERWGRQVVLPEVGGRGQERLLASHARLVGEGPAIRLAADLLERAGVRAGMAPGNVAVDLRVDDDTPGAATGPLVLGRTYGSRAQLVACPAGSTPPPALPTSGTPHTTDPLAICAVHALAALAALETLRLLIVPGGGVRRFEFDLGTGVFAARPDPGVATDGSPA